MSTKPIIDIAKSGVKSIGEIYNNERNLKFSKLELKQQTELQDKLINKDFIMYDKDTINKTMKIFLDMYELSCNDKTLDTNGKVTYKFEKLCKELKHCVIGYSSERTMLLLGIFINKNFFTEICEITDEDKYSTLILSAMILHSMKLDMNPYIGNNIRPFIMFLINDYSLKMECQFIKEFEKMNKSLQFDLEY